MNSLQYSIILGAIALFAGLYFGFDTKPKDLSAIELSRSIQGESTGEEDLLTKAKAKVNDNQLSILSSIEQKLGNASSASEKIPLLKDLSSKWYAIGELSIAGIYAMQVADLENADSAWSIAGATFYEALVKTQDQQMRDFCAQRSIKSFESAASLNPAQAEHRVNLALVYAENPPPDNPMKAVLMLKDLETKYPKSAAVYNALGRLAIKTGQWSKAIERLSQSWSLDKNNANTPCLLAKAYSESGDLEKSAEFAKLCK